MAGSTEIIPVFPMAVTMETAKMIAKEDLGRPLGPPAAGVDAVDMVG